MSRRLSLPVPVYGGLSTYRMILSHSSYKQILYLFKVTPMKLSEDAMNAIKMMWIDYEPAAIGIAQVVFDNYLKDLELTWDDSDKPEYRDYELRLTRLLDNSEDLFLTN